MEFYKYYRTRSSHLDYNYFIRVKFDIKLNLNSFYFESDTNFATTVTLSNRVPIETVSKLLGHSKITTTQIYARVIERKVSEDMKLLKTKLIANN